MLSMHRLPIAHLTGIAESIRRRQFEEAFETTINLTSGVFSEWQQVENERRSSFKRQLFPHMLPNAFDPMLLDDIFLPSFINRSEISGVDYPLDSLIPLSVEGLFPNSILGSCVATFSIGGSRKFNLNVF